MRTTVRFSVLGLAITAIVGAWWLRSAGATDAVAIGPNVDVNGATSEQLAMVRWAVGRFEAAGLKPPAVDIDFHGDGSGCGGHLGFARQGQVDLCTVLVNAMARRALLHEMSHAWLDQNVDADVREPFIDLRGLTSWNASGDPWALRGYEQGAEIVSWAIGERILSPQIPDNDPEKLELAYRSLTGVAPAAAG